MSHLGSFLGPQFPLGGTLQLVAKTVGFKAPCLQVPAPPLPPPSHAPPLPKGPAPRSSLGGRCGHVLAPGREEGEGIAERARTRRSRGRDPWGQAKPRSLKLWLSEDGPCSSLPLALVTVSPTFAPVQGLHLPCVTTPCVSIGLALNTHALTAATPGQGCYEWEADIRRAFIPEPRSCIKRLHRKHAC